MRHRLCSYYIISNTYTPHQTISLSGQLNYFNNMETRLRQELGEEEAKTLLFRAVYFFGIGHNDYYVPFTSNSSVLQSDSQEEYVNMVIGNLTTMIEVKRISVVYNIQNNFV